LEAYNADRVAAQIPTCKHTFCLSCLRTWSEAGRSSSNTCPMCKTALYRQFDDDDADSQAKFMQRLWTAIVDHRAANPTNAPAMTRSSRLFPTNAVFAPILRPLNFHRVNWGNLDEPLEDLVHTSRAMYYAIGLEEAPNSPVQALCHRSVHSWFEEVAFYGDVGWHSWESLAKATRELDCDRWPLECQLEHYTMRLLRDARNMSLCEPEYLRTITDRAILHRVQLLA